MSTNLTVLPLKGPYQLSDVLVDCYDRLVFDGDYRIFGHLIDMSEYCNDQEDIPSKPTIRVKQIPAQLWVYLWTDNGSSRTREDAFGSELTFAYVEQLKKIPLPDDVSPKNKAIMAFINALPPDTPIILYWH